MKTKALPEDLFQAYDWVDAAGEIAALTRMSESEADSYSNRAAANADAHDERICAAEFYGLWVWLRAETE